MSGISSISSALLPHPAYLAKRNAVQNYNRQSDLNIEFDVISFCSINLNFKWWNFFQPKIKCQTNLIYCQNYSKNKLIFNKCADSRVNIEHPTPVHYGAPPAPVRRSAKSKIKMKSLQFSTFTELICFNLCALIYSVRRSRTVSWVWAQLTCRRYSQLKVPTARERGSSFAREICSQTAT